MPEDTVFDRILSGEIPCDSVYSDELCLAFRDIQPVAPVHILIIPRKRLESLNSSTEADESLLGHLLITATKIAKQEGLKDWRAVINTGSEAGQTVFHLHIHLIGGRALTWPPG